MQLEGEKARRPGGLWRAQLARPILLFLLGLGMGVDTFLPVRQPLRAAEAVSAAPVEYSVRRFSGDDGLPQDSVNCVLQSAEGYLWIGTGFGLARFDGQRFTMFDRFNTPALQSDAITTLAEDATGHLWIGTPRGLVQLYQGRFIGPGQNKEYPTERVAALKVGRDGALWVGSAHGVTRIRGDELTRFGEAAGLEHEDVRELHELPDGRVLVHTSAGWQELDPKSGRFLGARERYVPGPGVEFALPSDHEGRAWMADKEGISVRLPDGWQRVLAFPPGRPIEGVAFYPHPAQGLVVQVSPLGVYQWNGRELTPLTSDRPELLRRARGAWLDREESLWLATADGLMRLQRRSVKVTGQRQGLLSDLCLTVSEGRDGTMWVGTAAGVNALRDGQVVASLRLAGPPPELGAVVLAAQDGRIWYSSGGPEVVCVNPGQPEKPVATLSLGRRRVRCLFEDRAGAVWVGTSAGLFKVTGTTTETFPGAEALAIYDVRVVHQDQRGVFWIGTHGSGLFRLTATEVKPLEGGPEAPTDEIRAVLEGRQGLMWVGTAAGLHLLESGRWHRFTRQQGLAENFINQLLEDNDGRLWISGVRGIHGVLIRDLLLAAEGRLSRVRCLTLNQLDGMVGAETSGGQQPAGARDQRGQLWFPTPNGVVEINPRRVRANEQTPRVLIEKLVADRQTFLPGDLVGALDRSAGAAPTRLRLSRGVARTLTVQFTAATFVQSELAHFRYRLIGYDKGWRDGGAARSATYTNLKPGDYEFEVVAANGHGYESDRPAVLRFTLTPQFHETWTFYFLCVAGAVAVSLLGAQRYSRYRAAAVERQHKALEIERARIAKDLHDELGASLTGLALQADLTSREFAGRAREEIANYANRSRELVNRMREVVWAVNPECDTLENFANYISEYVEHQPSSPEQWFRLDIPSDLPKVELRADVRHHLLMAFKEAVANALRHSRAREIRVMLRYADGSLQLTVSDNGQGLAPETAAGGNGAEDGQGLVNIRERLSALGGRVDIVSPVGEGTRVTMEVDLNRFAGETKSGAARSPG